MDFAALALDIKRWGAELGFQAVGIADADLSAAEQRLLEWLAQGWHGEMEYMAPPGALRPPPGELFSWSEADFDERLRRSPIRRIGYERWLRNLAVGLGNASTSSQVVEAL